MKGRSRVKEVIMAFGYVHDAMNFREERTKRTGEREKALSHVVGYVYIP